MFATLCEMAFAGRAGLSINLDMLTMEGEHAADQGDAKNWAGQIAERRNDLTLRAMFNEELGAVIQVRTEQRSEVMDVLRSYNLGANTLSKTYQNGFILLGQRYLFDGERIYSVYLSGGDSGTSGTKINVF